MTSDHDKTVLEQLIDSRPDLVAVASGTEPGAASRGSKERRIVTALSPNYSTDNLLVPLSSTEGKILVGCDRIRGWQLDIAQQCLDAIPHGAFGALAIAFSYFETIAQLESGTASNGQSRRFFDRGVESVFTGLDHRELEDAVLMKALWKGFRNGLYLARRSAVTRCHVPSSPPSVPPRSTPERLRTRYVAGGRS